MAENIRKKIQLYRTYQLGTVANDITLGEIALNYNRQSPFLMFKDNSGDIQKVGALSTTTGSSIYHTMTQKAITEALTASNDSSSEQIDKIEESVGLKPDGSYVPKNNLNYIGAETTVIGAINALDAALKNEESSRVSQDNRLEASVGLNADGTYAQRTDSNYISTASTVMGAVDILDVALKTEENARITQDDKIEASIGLNENGTYPTRSVSNYLRNASTVIGALDALDAALKTEETTRVAQDDKIEASIGLRVDGSYAQRTDSHYINNATTVVAAIDTLDVALKTEENARVAQDNKIEASIGLNADGTYIQRTDSNYINDATTVVDAIDLLDKKAKTSSDAIDAIETFIGIADGAEPVKKQISNAIESLDMDLVGGNGVYVDTVRQEDGKLYATSKTLIDPTDKVLTYTSGGATTTISIAKLTDSEVLQLGETNVKEAYKLIGKESQQLGDTIKIYKDQSLEKVEFANQILSFTYILADGSKTTIPVDVSSFLTESEYGNGLKVVDHVISAKLGEDTAENKNFLDLEGSEEGKKSLVVRSMDTDRTYTTEDITVMGGPLASLLTNVGINKIDAGTDIQTLLMTLLCKEIYPFNTSGDTWYMADEYQLGNQAKIAYQNPSFSSSIAAPTIDNFTAGTVEAGTKFTYSVTVPAVATSNTTSKVSNLTWGYSANDDDSADSTATAITKSWSSSISNDSYTLSTTISGFNGASKASVTGTNASRPTYSLEVQVADGGNKVTVNVTGCTHSASVAENSSVYMVSNLGKTDANIKTNVISAKTVTTTAPTNSANKTVTGSRQSFAGTKQGTTGIENAMTLNSANIRGLGGKGFSTTFSITIPNGTSHVYIALPPGKTLKSVADTGAFGTDIVASFKANTNSNIAVEGANGYTSKNYTVYIYAPDAALGSNTYNVTIQ